jgi:hypothetical protein
MTVSLAAEHARVLDEAFAPWRGRRVTDFRQAALQRAHASLLPWQRFWFCVAGGNVWLRPPHRCREAGHPGCGFCAMGGHRREAFLLGLYEYLTTYPPSPSFDVCTTVCCRDLAAVSFISSAGWNPSRRWYVPPPLVLSYSASPYTADIPFPDYSIWPPSRLAPRGQRIGWEAVVAEIEAQPIAWERKLDRALLAFGEPPELSWKRAQPAAKLPLRHALWHGRCDLESGGSIAVANGPSGSEIPGKVSKAGFCRWKMIVLTHGSSNWRAPRATLTPP